MSEQDDALTVAKWHRPEREWETLGGRPIRCHSHGEVYFFAEDRNDIAAAEQIVLARGLAEQYGRALAAEVTPGATEYPGGRTASLSVNYGMVAALATAPLDSRLRALAKVARKNPQCGYDQHKDAKP